jgi:hypothetical protein
VASAERSNSNWGFEGFGHGSAMISCRSWIRLLGQMKLSSRLIWLSSSLNLVRSPLLSLSSSHGPKGVSNFYFFVLSIVLALSWGVAKRLQVKYSPKTVNPIVELFIGRCCGETIGGLWHCSKTGVSLDGTGVSHCGKTGVSLDETGVSLIRGSG